MRLIKSCFYGTLTDELFGPSGWHNCKAGEYKINAEYVNTTKWTKDDKDGKVFSCDELSLDLLNLKEGNSKRFLKLFSEAYNSG